MLLRELFSYRTNEGGWDSLATQSTVVKPAVVKSSLSTMAKFAKDFNTYLAKQGLGPIQVGHPTGSSAYYEVDPEDKIYGDVDLQMIAPETEHTTHSQFQAYWNALADDFVKQTNPPYIHQDPEAKPGHPIVQIGPDQYVQVDFMWHMEKTREWGRYRATPERGVKGLLNGNMFSVLGSLLGMSIQHAGVQLKVIKGVPVSFQKKKDTEVITVSTNPKSFVYDILNYLFEKQYGRGQPKVDPLLKQYPGVTTDIVKISSLVNAVKGLANSFELNNMYGSGLLTNYSNSDDFVDKFWNLYERKAIEEVSKAKRDKAVTPDAIARAEDDKKKIMQGLEMVKGLFGKGEEQAVSEAGKRLTKQGVDVSRVNREDFFHIKSTLNPLLQKAGLTAGWTSGGAGSFDPEHMFGGGGREDSGDVDIMIDPNDLVNNFQIDLEEFNRVAPKPMGPKALANALADPAKVAKLKMVAAKWSLADFLTKNGFPTDPGTLTVQFSRGPINYSVDLIIRPKSAWPLHTHDFTRDPKMRGGDLWNIYPKLAKLASSTTFVDPKTGEEKGNLQYSPDRGLVDRDTNKVVAIDKDAIAKIIIGPEATARDISSLSGLRDVLQRYPEKWAEVEPLFPREEK